MLRTSEIELEVSGDRTGEFEPVIIQKHQRRFDGFDDLISSLYARGHTAREIRAHIEEIYGVEVSPDLISTVKDKFSEPGQRRADAPVRISLSARLFEFFAGQSAIDKAVQNTLFLLLASYFLLFIL